uniref:CCT domain-containing protein n=1 Tax=Oryza meridionalis TaxID=40149 RepID=A0A0E0DVA5_9ORYZ
MYAAMYPETFCFSAYPQQQQQPPPDAASCIYTAALPLIADPPDILGNMAQPSLLSQYDLGGEGDLFKAPEPIIEEPVLSLDPVAAAISMMSGSENVMDETIEVADISDIQNDSLLSEVLYECEKELMEKSAIEETISELLDVKIPMLQVEEFPRETQVEEVVGHVQLPAMEKEKPSVPECCSLQKSVSSGCLNSADWINGPARPNFLDFQGLDFETAFGLRRAYSEGDIQNLGASTPRPGNSGNVQLASCERLVTISDLKSEERKQKLSRYRKKKVKRNFGRKIKYACRKALADSQPRVRGRFAKIEEGDLLKPRK